MKLIRLSALLCTVLALTPTGRSAEHPRLFFTLEDVPAMQARAESTEWLRDMKAAVVVRADEYLELSTTPYPLTNAENSKGTAGRAVQRRVGILSLAGYLTADETYHQKAAAMLMAVVRQFEADNQDHWPTHLQYSDAAQGIAIGYDLTYPFLTPAERAEVRDELRKYGHQIFTDRSAWGAPSPGVTSCNHNSVQFGALGLTALILGDEPGWLARATDRVRGFFKYFVDPTGYVTEGHHYLTYGQIGAYPFSLALARSGGPDLLAEQPLLTKINDQTTWVLLPFDGELRTLNDNDPQPVGPVAVAHALRAGDPVQLWGWLQAIGPDGNGANGLGRINDGFGELFPFISGDTPLEPVSPAEAGWPLGRSFESGRVFLRSSWDDLDAAHVAITSGYDMHQGHNHQDENAVAFAALGEDFLTDPGYWPDSSSSHTTLRINGAEQQVGSIGRIVEYREDASGAFVRAQAPEAYPLVPNFIGHAERKIYFVRDPQPYLVWRDDVGIESKRPLNEVVSRYVTRIGNTITNRGNGAVIHGENGRGSALVLAFAEDQPVIVREDDLAGLSYTANAQKEIVYVDHLKRLSATTVAHSPRLVTLVLPFRDEAELPTVKVDYEEASDKSTVRLSFPDGRTDVILFDATNAEFSRSR